MIIYSYLRLTKYTVRRSYLNIGGIFLKKNDNFRYFFLRNVVIPLNIISIQNLEQSLFFVSGGNGEKKCIEYKFCIVLVWKIKYCINILEIIKPSKLIEGKHFHKEIHHFFNRNHNII